MGEKTGEGQSGGVNIGGRVGSVGGDIVGRDKITYGQTAEELVAVLEAKRVIRAADLERQTIVKLAQRLNPDAKLDFDQAVRKLERTVARSLEGTAPPEVEGLREEARAATERGAFDEADGLLRRIRDVIDVGAAKAVLILGRFTPERKAVLDALRSELRRRGYAPMLFDFEKPASRTVDETVTLLARVARFIIADISDAKSVLQELRGIVPDLPSVPVQPLILASQEEPGMFDFFDGFRSVLKKHRYDTPEQLIADLDERVIRPAETKVRELRGSKVEVAGTPSAAALDAALRPLIEAIVAAPAEKRPEAEAKLAALKQEAAKGKSANDGVLARLVDGLVGLVPGAASAVVSAFATPILGGIAGPVTGFVLDKLRGT